MAIHAISKSRFDQLFTTKQNIVAKTEERAWFATDGEKILGAVIFDGNDDDWAYVVLERADDNEFRCTEANSCFESQAVATQKLRESLVKREKL
jgi:hypothetical protein